MIEIEGITGVSCFAQHGHDMIMRLIPSLYDRWTNDFLTSLR